MGSREIEGRWISGGEIQRSMGAEDVGNLTSGSTGGKGGKQFPHTARGNSGKRTVGARSNTFVTHGRCDGRENAVIAC